MDKAEKVIDVTIAVAPFDDGFCVVIDFGKEYGGKFRSDKFSDRDFAVLWAKQIEDVCTERAEGGIPIQLTHVPE